MRRESEQSGGLAISLSKVSFFTVLLGSLFVTYLVVASLIAFFTVKIVGIPIGPKMTTKIVLTIILFIPLYLILAYILSLIVTRDLRKLEKGVERLPEAEAVPESRIREFSRLGEVIREQARKISSMLSDQRLLIYRIAHDLRTPTANIRNILTAIKDGVIKEEERKTYIERAIRETHRISEFLDLALTGLKKAAKEREPEVIDLGEIVSEVAQDWKLRAEERGFDLEVLTQEAKVQVPRSEVEEILSNLIENAILHSGGNKVEIKVFREGEKAFLEVSDNGRGPKKERLIDSYRKGSIGLYIVKELVFRRRGDLEISSDQNGTKVAVSFPLV